MNWRNELRGVSRVNLGSAALLVPVTIWAGAVVLSQETRETRTEETQVQKTQETRAPAEEYQAVWDWCGIRFPFRKDLQEACRWGAYEMLPGPTVPADEGIRDA